MISDAMLFFQVLSIDHNVITRVKKKELLVIICYFYSSYITNCKLN